nr:23S rRNA (pseudouridine(1915)-N(3))-methyltransferase RlmH [uncultured Cetobacterium sp.]
MNINIICVGKIKEKYIIDGIQEFSKRMQPFAKFKIIELKEDGNDNNRNISIEKESKAIMETLEKNKGYLVLLDIQGKNFSSEEMADKIEKIGVNGNNTINFVIGGSYGTSDSLRSIADLKLSFSKMTFPHQLMRLILVEQIYRWFSILKNTKYHK